jgi:hypothetical protein
LPEVIGIRNEDGFARSPVHLGRGPPVIGNVMQHPKRADDVKSVIRKI